MSHSKKNTALDELHDKSFRNHPQRVAAVFETFCKPKVLTTVQQSIVPTNRFSWVRFVLYFVLFCFVFCFVLFCFVLI